MKEYLGLSALLGVFACASAGAGPRETGTARLRFELSFPTSARGEAVDGRVFVIITRKTDPEPRLQFGKSGGQYASVPFFGADVDGLKPGQQAVIDSRSPGYPLDRLGDVPPGDYFVQGFLNVYTTFHRADGHVVKMHMDQWEGQNFPISPGNLYSEPRKIRLDPAAGGPIRILLDRKIPPVEVPPDTPYVMRVRFESPLLSKFWRRPIFMGATVLLPKDYDRDVGVFYPVNYEQGHFSLRAPGGFLEKVEDKPDPSGRPRSTRIAAGR